MSGRLPDLPADYWRASFDGAALPNGGKIGLGGVLVSPDGQRRESSRLAGCGGCGNEAELLALCEVLDLAHAAGARRLVIQGDSDFAVRHVLGLSVTAVPRFAPLLGRAQELLRLFEHAVLRWVPRHRNGDADRLSRQALALPERAAPKPKRRRLRGK